MTGGLLITFREGLEAFLVVGIILSYLARVDLKRYNKWVYTGVGLGLVSAFVLAFFFQLFYSGFQSARAELYIKIGIMGFAVVVLTYMLIWMAKNSRLIKGSVEKQLDDIVSSGSIFALVFMAYLAILREGFETVLFLSALYGNEMGAQALYGSAIGLVLAFVVTMAIFKGMKNVPIRFFFKMTGVMILVIAAGLLNNMIGIMQDISLLPVVKSAIFDLSWLMRDSSDVGIFFKALFGYTHSPSLLQILAYVMYITGAIYFLNWSEKPMIKRKLAHA
jgi:high-affinity iron transporter